MVLIRGGRVRDDDDTAAGREDFRRPRPARVVRHVGLRRDRCQKTQEVALGACRRCGRYVRGSSCAMSTAAGQALVLELLDEGKPQSWRLLLACLAERDAGAEIADGGHAGGRRGSGAQVAFARGECTV